VRWNLRRGRNKDGRWKQRRKKGKGVGRLSSGPVTHPDEQGGMREAPKNDFMVNSQEAGENSLFLQKPSHVLMCSTLSSQLQSP
jgi:hypothetical protein